MKEIDNEQGVSDYTGVAVKTLQNRRLRGEDPPYIKLGVSVRYRKADVDAWLESNTVTPGAA